MHIQIVNFRLKDLSESEYAQMATDLAPQFADLPGLLGKVWLASADTGTYGGVYLWESRDAMLKYGESELFHAVANHPNLTEITSVDFAEMEGPTAITRGAIGAGRAVHG
jgi:heme-degrading monooxygenase HmoA